MTLSLDTNVLIDLSNGRRPAVRRNFDRALGRGEVLVTCAVAAHELIYGAIASPRPEFHRAVASRILSDVSVIAFSAGDAEASAELRVRLRRAGEPIGAFDTFIAAQALSRGWTVVTGNMREFGRVPGLAAIDWTLEPDRQP